MAETRSLLVCCNAYPPNFVGGAELIAHYQAKALQRRGHKVSVLAAERQPFGAHYAMRRDTYDGVPVYQLQVTDADYAADRVSFHRPELDHRFEEVLDEVPADVAHMHNMIGLSLGMIAAAKRRGLRAVVTLHDHWGFCLKNIIIKGENQICPDFKQCAECQPFISDGRDRGIPIRMRNDYLALAFDLVDAFISPSEYLAKTYVRAGLPVGKMHVIWNGVDVARFSGVLKSPRNGTIRFTFLGYFGEHKGMATILDALPLLGDPRRWRLHLVGDGPLRPVLEQRVAEMKLGDSIRFWGKVAHHQIEDVFRETDVQILPSIWPENQPVSITESMAARTPVIATHLGGVPELVLDGVTGFLFQPGEAAQLADRMRRFLDDPERIEALGARAFERIQENTFDHQVERILRLYNWRAPQ